MKTLGYYNGTWGPLDEMTVPMNDRASWFGDGVYDAGPARNYRMFAMDEHIDRFFRSAAALEIEVPVTKSELADLLNDLMRKMDTGDLLGRARRPATTTAPGADNVNDHASWLRRRLRRGPGSLRWKTSALQRAQRNAPRRPSWPTRDDLVTKWTRESSSATRARARRAGDSPARLAMVSRPRFGSAAAL